MMINLKYILFLLIVGMSVVLSSCGPKELSYVEKREKKSKSIPLDAYPEVYYRKFGDNWFRYNVTVPYRPGHTTNYPILDVDYVQGKRLPMIVEAPIERETMTINKHYMKRYQRHIMDAYDIRSFTLHGRGPTKLFGLKKSPPGIQCQSEKYKWPSLGEHFQSSSEIVYRPNGSVLYSPKGYRSKEPVFFDQHVSVSFGTWHNIATPDPNSCQYVDSAYPYLYLGAEIRVKRDVDYSQDVLREMEAEKRIKADGPAFDKRLYVRFKFLEAIVKDIYVGPELPEDVMTAAKEWSASPL